MTDITEELLELKQELDKTTELLNQKIQIFENDLQKLSLGIAVWINLSEKTRLGYNRFGDKWQILVEYEDFGERKTLPLLRSARTLRVYCYKHLPELLPALKEAAKSILEKIQKEINNNVNNGISNK